MRFLFLLLSVACFSCSSREPSVKTDSLAVHMDSSGKPASAEALPAFAKLDTVVPFAGIWVTQAYIQHVRSSRSPHDAQAGGACIIIPSRTLRSTMMIYGFHEGGPSLVVVRDGADYKLCSEDMKTFSKTIEPIGDSLIRIGDQAFLRLRHPDTTLYDYGTLEENLFEGKYQDFQGHTVVFTANGQVSGLDSLSRYEPQVDYTEVLDQLDRVRLGVTTKQMDYFGYRFDGDSLILYTIDCSANFYDTAYRYCDSGVLGKRLYTLVRMKEGQ